MSQQSNTGSFVVTTNIWDIAQIQNIDLNSKEFRDLLVRLYQNINNISLVLNKKETGYYPLQEFLDSNLYFPSAISVSGTAQSSNYRQAYRMTINFGALPDTATKSVPHGINPNQNYIFTDIRATASNSIGYSYLPIPYASATSANIIEISIDKTNINITTGKNMTAYTNTIVVLEYLKQ